MTTINLLPWREELRAERQKEYLTILIGAVLLALVVVVVVRMTYAADIEYQKARNAFINAKIAGLDQKIKEINNLEVKRKELEQRMDIIQRLQLSRPVIVHAFDELVKTVPNGVYLSEFTRQNDTFTFKGRTESNTRVAKFMRNLDDSLWYRRPVLSSITANRTPNSSGKSGSNFVMTVALEKPEAGGLR